MTLDLRDLRLVETVAQHGSLTRAAPALFLTQSALSRQLSDLERRMGTQLFSRQRKRMVLSPAGERLCEHARTILKDVQLAEEDVRQGGRVRAALLRFSTECYTCYHWLPAVLSEYRKRHPDVETRIVADVTRRPIPALARGQIDVAIVARDVKSPRFTVTELFSDELVAVVAPDHPWASRKFVEASDFTTEHLFMYHISLADSTLYQQVLLPAGVVPQQYSVVELTEAKVELVKAGLGVAVLARWAVAPHVKAGTLKAVPLTSRGLHRRWSAVTIRSKPPVEHVDAFVNVLRRQTLAPTAPLRLINGAAAK